MLDEVFKYAYMEGDVDKSPITNVRFPKKSFQTSWKNRDARRRWEIENREACRSKEQD